MEKRLNAIDVDGFGEDVAEHRFFSRLNGYSSGLYNSLSFARNDSNAPKNRGVVAAEFLIDPTMLKTVEQIHSDKVVIVDEIDQHTSYVEADALVTKIPGLVLGVVTADCCPILFVDEVNKVVGAAHAGWRGAISQIIDNTIDAMCYIGAEKKDIRAALGPCIAQESYEVDAAFKDAFLSKNNNNTAFFKASERDGYFMFNLPAYVEYRLRAYGIKNVSNVNIDTYTNEELFFSCRRATHRREQGFGLQMSAIMLL